MNDERNDDRPVNPHTGQPVPEDRPAAAPAGGAPAQPGQQPTTGTGGTAAGAGGAMTGAAPAGAAAAPSQQEMAIRSALETVMDPEINLSVIDLGLIREIQLQPEKTLIRMMLTTPFCPYAPQLMADVKQATMSVVPRECEVDLMPDAWSPDLMPDPSLLGYSF
jgi:metal-sulfur cluster biosynthetic enzyme